MITLPNCCIKFYITFHHDFINMKFCIRDSLADLGDKRTIKPLTKSEEQDRPSWTIY